jgi:hypothetical protein
VEGSLSRQLGGINTETARATVAAVVDLPQDIGLVSLRDLGWPMAALLADGARLNLLSLEALAAAAFLDAPLCLARADINAPLQTQAEQRHIELRVID